MLTHIHSLFFYPTLLSSCFWYPPGLLSTTYRFLCSLSHVFLRLHFLLFSVESGPITNVIELSDFCHSVQIPVPQQFSSILSIIHLCLACTKFLFNSSTENMPYSGDPCSFYRELTVLMVVIGFHTLHLLPIFQFLPRLRHNNILFCFQSFILLIYHILFNVLTLSDHLTEPMCNISIS